MYAIEFEAPIQNGVVHIPSEYKELQETDRAKVIIMIKEPISAIVSSIKNISTTADDVDMVFNKFQIDMTNFKFNRDEANER
ncbi:MAG: hypothetical protein JHC37_02240 [Campylobacteraceae bacterium]|jgi:hypothetical protein|nr:hypothetical protein [Campylobacteraceae bacterium]